MCVLYSFSMLGSLQKNVQSKAVSGEVRAATLCWDQGQSMPSSPTGLGLRVPRFLEWS